MILWFGSKKKKAEAEAAGREIAAQEAADAQTPDTGSPDVTASEDISGPEEVARPEPAEPEFASSPEPEPETEPQTEPEQLTPPPAGPEPVAVAPSVAATPPEPDTGFFGKLTKGLSRSSSKLSSGLAGVFTKEKLDAETLEDLEDLLLTSDLGAPVAARITANLARDRFEKNISDADVRAALATEIETVMARREKLVDFSDGPRPRIVLFVGVNGSGKTTTIGKIASKLKAQGAKALLVAGDTFRAAAIEQLTVWGDRAGIPVMSKPAGADPAGLVYEAVERARREDLDLVLIDTAGRLQNRAELMEELTKVIRVTRKLEPDAPHDVILVLDATVGQNALSQVESFYHKAGVTGLVMTKLDGTAKGGVLVAIAEAYDLPIHFVGVGESAEDLHPFSARAFSRALVGLDN